MRRLRRKAFRSCPAITLVPTPRGSLALFATVDRSLASAACHHGLMRPAAVRAHRRTRTHVATHEQPWLVSGSVHAMHTQNAALASTEGGRCEEARNSAVCSALGIAGIAHAHAHVSHCTHRADLTGACEGADCQPDMATGYRRELSLDNRWHGGLSGGTPGTTTIIICTTWCAHRYISQVRSFRVLIFMYQAKVSSWYDDGRSCPICTRCFHRCSARIPTITSIVAQGSKF